MIVTLDFYSSNFYIKAEAEEYHWNSAQQFILDTQYPFLDTKLLSLEPHRDIYHVRRDGSSDNSIDAPEIAWLLANEPILSQKVATLAKAAIPIITLEQQRIQLLYDTDWIVQRHQEELLLGVTPTLTQQQLIGLLNYKQQLRNLTNTYSPETPASAVVWPTNPIH